MTAGLQSACDRCGAPCRMAAEAANDDARLLQFAKAPKGFCGDCAVTQWLKTMPPICDMLARSPEKVHMLRDPGMRLQFARIMLAGNADLPSGHINWDRVVEMWERPFPKNALRRQM